MEERHVNRPHTIRFTEPFDGPREIEGEPGTFKIFKAFEYCDLDKKGQAVARWHEDEHGRVVEPCARTACRMLGLKSGKESFYCAPHQVQEDERRLQNKIRNRENRKMHDRIKAFAEVMRRRDRRWDAKKMRGKHAVLITRQEAWQVELGRINRVATKHNLRATGFGHVSASGRGPRRIFVSFKDITPFRQEFFPYEY